MIDTLRRWHWTLLHRVFGLPERDHTAPYSHPPVPAHGRHFTQPRQPSLQSQLERERQREPRVLKGWQRSIRNVFERQSDANRSQ